MEREGGGMRGMRKKRGIEIKMGKERERERKKER